MPFHLTSCQARNTFPLMRELAGYIQERLGVDTGYEHDTPWRERLRKVLRGDLQLAWICSKPYALQLDEAVRPLHGVAVPVMAGSLYASQAVYYSYLAVRAEQDAASIRDLRGCRAAYNEPGSQSGYFSLLGALHEIGETEAFFSAWMESGAHTHSVDMILAGDVEVAAIDSTLWDYEAATEERGRLERLRIVDTLGPYPGPPLAVHRSVDEGLRAELGELLAGMHRDPKGQEILALSRISHFVPVEDDAYRVLT